MRRRYFFLPCYSELRDALLMRDDILSARSADVLRYVRLDFSACRRCRYTHARHYTSYYYATLMNVDAAAFMFMLRVC